MGSGCTVIGFPEAGTAVWFHNGLPPVHIRWVLICDPDAAFRPQALLCTDVTVTAPQILEWFVLRWQLEVTFEEARAHLGIETQRQWSDLAILPTRQAAWYTKQLPTFADTLAFVRQRLTDALAFAA
jgi:hypothetical protein